jgi:general secretion pathway protein E
VSTATATGSLGLREILLSHTRLSEEQLGEALERQEESGGRLLDILVELALLNEDEIIDACSKQLGLPVRTSIGADEIDESLALQVPIGFAKTHGLLPLGRSETGAIHVALSDPFETAPLDDLRLLFQGAEIETELASRRTIMAAINQVYDRGPGSTSELVEDATDDLETLADEISHEPQDLLDASDEAPIIRLVNSLLQLAVKERASDVHIEPFEKEIRVRFRIDDILYEPMKPLPRALHPSIVSRIKIMGHMNIAEKRLPQDGRIRLKIAGRDYDVRLSTLPVSHGERVVLRLLPRSADLLNLETLGFDRHHLDIWENLIKRSNGIVLVTGPTGSGKTTTLYGALSRINTTDKNIITIEEPVEIQLPGIGQIEVTHKIGLDFALGLRHILRQNPDVILVGEIRDLETAEIAIQASLTGHLVFSTLHTNDAPSALTRLVDMGVEAYLVASSLVAVLAQRLVRVVCTDCREEVDATPEECREIGMPIQDPPLRIFRPVGCPRCNHTGYRGRIGVFELMLVDDEIRSLMAQNVDAKTLKRKAIEKGMSSLRGDGARKVMQGLTSVAEIVRATEEEGVVAQI